mgnify:CR=1 FL=1
MEKSVEFEIADYIKEVLEMKEVEPEGYSLHKTRTMRKPTYNRSQTSTNQW